MMDKSGFSYQQTVTTENYKRMMERARVLGYSGGWTGMVREKQLMRIKAKISDACRSRRAQKTVEHGCPRKHTKLRST